MAGLRRAAFFSLTPSALFSLSPFSLLLARWPASSSSLPALAIIAAGFLIACCQRSTSPSPVSDQFVGSEKSSTPVSSAKITLPLIAKTFANFARDGRTPTPLPGASIRNTTAPGGQTLLHEAALQNKAAAISSLLAAGLKADALNLNQETPLHFAAALGNRESLAELLKRGAPADIADAFGRTPLHLAIMYGQTETALRLLSAGANPNARDGWGWNALHWAVYHSNASATRALLQHAANPDAKDRRGRTPFSLAENKPELLRLLSNSKPP